MFPPLHTMSALFHSPTGFSRFFFKPLDDGKFRARLSLGSLVFSDVRPPEQHEVARLAGAQLALHGVRPQLFCRLLQEEEYSAVAAAYRVLPLDMQAEIRIFVLGVHEAERNALYVDHAVFDGKHIFRLGGAVFDEELPPVEIFSVEEIFRLLRAGACEGRGKSGYSYQNIARFHCVEVILFKSGRSRKYGEKCRKGVSPPQPRAPPSLSSAPRARKRRGRAP